MKIYKYPIAITDEQEIVLPVGATILTVQTQQQQPHIWALVDETLVATEVRVFLLHGTGNPIENALGKHSKYIGTFQMLGGNLIWHLFEVVPFSGM